VTDDARRNVLDELAEQFGGGRNPRKEAEALRGRFLTLWMDFEVSLDTAIGEFLEVPEHRWDAMEYGLLALLPTGRKVDFLQIVVKSVDPASDAFNSPSAHWPSGMGWLTDLQPLVSSLNA